MEKVVKKQCSASDKWLKFHVDLLGFDIYLNGVRQFKWEVFSGGFTNTSEIIQGKTKFTIEPKEDVFGEVA